METILRNEQGYKLEKVKRNFAGSYAITFEGKKSKIQYNAETVKVLLKKTSAEFIEYAKFAIQFNN